MHASTSSREDSSRRSSSGSSSTMLRSAGFAAVAAVRTGDAPAMPIRPISIDAGTAAPAARIWRRLIARSSMTYLPAKGGPAPAGSSVIRL